MRFCFFILFSFVGLACAFGQASSKPVLYYLKENLIKAPVDVPKGKQLVWEQVYYEKGKLINRRSLLGRYTANPNEFMARLDLGEAIIVVSLDGKEVWKQTFVVRRSTNVLYKGQENDIIAEVDLPYATDLIFETDNGHIRSRHLYASPYPAQEGKCTITAKHQGKIVWQNTFEVRNLPSYTLYLGNTQEKAIDVSKPLPANAETRICINVDSTFKQSLRNGGYRVGEVAYTLSRGGKTIKTDKIGGWDTIPAPQYLGARSGDKMLIQVLAVHHVIPHGHRHEIKLPPISSFEFVVR